MKGTTILCLLLFLAMLCLPFLAVGANLPDSLLDSPRVTDSGPSADFEKASFRIRDESTNQILTVGDRDFLYGAIVTEMSPNAEPEALKAQAVAAYTYYSRQRAQAHEKGADSDFSADPQNWKVYVSKEQMQERWGDSYQAYYEKLTEVINSIAGQTLQSNGELIDATYFAISSGKTESSETSGEENWTTLSQWPAREICLPAVIRPRHRLAPKNSRMPSGKRHPTQTFPATLPPGLVHTTGQIPVR